MNNLFKISNTEYLNPPEDYNHIETFPNFQNKLHNDSKCGNNSSHAVHLVVRVREQHCAQACNPRP